MKKFINNNDDFLKESHTGYGKAHSDIININLDPSFVSRKKKTKAGSRHYIHAYDVADGCLFLIKNRKKY